MPSLSRKNRKRHDTLARRKAEGDLLNLTSQDVAKLPVQDDLSIANLDDRVDTKEDTGTSDVVPAEHQLEGALSEVGEASHGEYSDPSEDVEAATFSQRSLEDVFTSTPPVNSDGDAVEMTPNPPSKKKVKRAKTHRHDCPQNPSRKLLFDSSKPKGNKTSKKTSQRVKRKQQGRKAFQKRDIYHQGVWVQCENFLCRKWRFLSSITDPAKVEQNWTCEMHPDDTFNSCDKPEEDYSHLEFIHNQFTEGSIVWAKMQRYPWWPAMVESDPDTGCFVDHEGVETEVTHYHCVFLDKNVSRSWVPAIFVKTFVPDGNPPGSLVLKKRDYAKQVIPAKERALAALTLPLKERIEKYGFGTTYKGVWKEKKSRKNTFHNGDTAHLENASDIDADDVLGDMLSSEDMEELMNETEGLMAEAQEAVQEMSDDENILCKVAHEEKRKSKRSRKRKSSECDEESRVKRKKHKKKKSKHKKCHQVKSIEKKKKKKPPRETSLKDEVKLIDGENDQDDKNSSCKSELKETHDEVLNMEKKTGNDNEKEELNHVMQEEKAGDSADVDEEDENREKGDEGCDEAAYGDTDENGNSKEVEINGCVGTNEIEQDVEGMPVLPKENIAVDRNDNKVAGECGVGGKDSHYADNSTNDVKVTGKKYNKTTKAEREEKCKEREAKRQLALAEKETKKKEKEIRKLKREKAKQEKEEKRKEREIKKQQALEKKEQKRKAKIEKNEKEEKKAKNIHKVPKSSEEAHKDKFKETVITATGDAKDAADVKAKKRKFSVPKGKRKAFIPPEGNPNTTIPIEQKAKVLTHSSQTLMVGDADRNESEEESDRAIPLNEFSGMKDEESKSVIGNSVKEKPCLIKTEKMKNSGTGPKLKRKKFSVKRKESCSDSAGKAWIGKSTPSEFPVTKENDFESEEGKVNSQLDSKIEILLMGNKVRTENPPYDSHVTVRCSTLESKGSDSCEEVDRDTREFEANKNDKEQFSDGSRQTKEDQEVDVCENEDVLDLEWSEAPEMTGKKSLVASVNDEDSDPFEAVEE